MEHVICKSRGSKYLTIDSVIGIQLIRSIFKIAIKLLTRQFFALHMNRLFLKKISLSLFGKSTQKILIFKNRSLSWDLSDKLVCTDYLTVY